MSEAERADVPQRVRVTSPRRMARRPEQRSRYRDLVEETALGEVYVEAILRAQRRLAAGVLLGIVILLGALGAALLVLPGALRTPSAAAPSAWITLGVLVYPVAWLVTWRYVRVAERIEREFIEMMDQP